MAKGEKRLTERLPYIAAEVKQAELISRLHLIHPEFYKVDLGHLIDDLVEVIAKALIAREAVTFKSFGRLEPRYLPPKKCAIVKGGQTKPSIMVKFVAAKRMRQDLAKSVAERPVKSGEGGVVS